jgi:hypothetical protein
LVCVFVVVVVVVVVVAVVGAEAVVVGAVVAAVGAVVAAVVGVGLVTVVVSSPPLSAAITASAATKPSTTADRSAIAHLAPRLMPPGGGGRVPEGGSGWPMWRVGSSCTARASLAGDAAGFW